MALVSRPIALGWKVGGEGGVVLKLLSSYSVSSGNYKPGKNCPAE